MPAVEMPSQAFFELVHRLLAEDEAQESTDRRTGDRRPYRCAQLIAPYDRGRLPSAADFRLVQCEDISERGLAFYEGQEPKYGHIVVALGVVPFTFVTGEVAHYKPVRNNNGDLQHLVGVRFTGRVGT